MSLLLNCFLVNLPPVRIVLGVCVLLKSSSLLLHSSPCSHQPLCCSLCSPSAYLSQSFCTCCSLFLPSSCPPSLTLSLCSSVTSADRLLWPSWLKQLPLVLCLLPCVTDFRTFVVTSHYRTFYIGSLQESG